MSQFHYEPQPYYIVAPDYAQTLSGAQFLHQLCHLLNLSGFEAYVESPSIHGGLWTPPLNVQVKVAHYKANRKPIVVYPEWMTSDTLKLGVPVRYILNQIQHQKIKNLVAENELVYERQRGFWGASAPLFLPVVDANNYPVPEQDSARTVALFYLGRFKGDPLKCHPDAVELSDEKLKNEQETICLLQRAKVLYVYDWALIAIEARLCGCPVVCVTNPQCLTDQHSDIGFYGDAGLAWGMGAEEFACANTTVLQFRNQYLESVAQWQEQLAAFIATTQAAANTLTLDLAWPQATVDTLPGIYTEGKDLAARADRNKWFKLNQQYSQWTERSSLREIDAQIYAEMLVNGELPQLKVLIDQRASSLDALADTIDSLATCLGQPAEVIIVSHDPIPGVFVDAGAIRWIQISENGLGISQLNELAVDWVLLVLAGTVLAPHALIEFSWAATDRPDCMLIYSDEDVLQAQGKHAFPLFKSDANIELLRCTNYLGSAVLVSVDAWVQSGLPLFDGGIYGYALELLATQGKKSIGHVDSVLFHAPAISSGVLENQEFEAARKAISKHAEIKALRPLDWFGTWLVEYVAPEQTRVSLVMATGLQTGYLRSFLLALKRYPEPSLVDIVLVCQPVQAAEVSFVCDDFPALQIQIIEFEQAQYNHGAALNKGIEFAQGDFVLIADDDTEPVHADWLKLLLSYFAQSDVACVAPRLVASRDKDPKLVGGPMFLGICGVMAAYVGEEQRLDEIGVYSRLQLAQDVSAVAGHFFVLRKSDWVRVNGFDSQTFGLYFTVLDFCLRLSQLGRRHVWTPLAGVMHHGGKTFESLRRDIRQQLALAQREIQERESLLERWAPQLAKDPNYNRHLSFAIPFDIEADIVVDWQPRRHDRPRTMAVALFSGAGQYRVVEPLNALQDAGLVQSCVVLPLPSRAHRILSPLDVVRAAPDCLILQHSVDDGQLRQIEYYKKAAPNLRIVQMVDDLFGEVPEKHPNREFQSREGHQRMMQALIKSDRLIVTTQTLADHYRKYVDDVHIVPNMLAYQWQGLRNKPKQRSRLRIGWVGAGQHQGDLELISAVVSELAAEVDWVFMGMCTDGIRPYLKEFHHFVSISEYPKKIAELDLDIAIAPLEDNIFNRCKSNLRLLEYGAMGWPVVCSDVYPYQTDEAPVLRVKDDKDAWLTEIRRLFDHDFRAHQSDLIYNWVKSRYTLEEKTSLWKKAIFD
jgi:glycosyltransferase involved in cell wall biosynthesis